MSIPEAPIDKDVSAGLGKIIDEYLARCFAQASAPLQRDTEAVIFIPRYALKSFRAYLDNLVNYPVGLGQKIEYMGHALIEGYENAVIMVSPYYPLNNDPNAISRIDFK